MVTRDSKGAGTAQWRLLHVLQALHERSGLQTQKDVFTKVDGTELPVLPIRRVLRLL